ncbi:Hypothetical predicted protein [Cloeon dipterum]|uniref:Uncharacterized protein n=1 Tax=Cloeon dipterum TaxID=197152 RepID=A0A8S1C9G3_9INSE|nr:Hypothetical predicted protein [Cloeon dipterum]
MNNLINKEAANIIVLISAALWSIGILYPTWTLLAHCVRSNNPFVNFNIISSVLTFPLLTNPCFWAIASAATASPSRTCTDHCLVKCLASAAHIKCSSNNTGHNMLLASRTEVSNENEFGSETLAVRGLSVDEPHGTQGPTEGTTPDTTATKEGLAASVSSAEYGGVHVRSRGLPLAD